MSRPKLGSYAVVGATLLVLAACGGGSGEDSPLGEVFEGIGDAAGEGQDEGSGGIPGAGEAGPVTANADPTKAWVEVDGQRLDFQVSGSVHHECHISDEQVRINYQQTETGDLLIQGQRQAGGWFLNLTTATLDSNVSYGATLPGTGTLGLSESELSFEGTADRVEDFDITNATAVDIALAVNCTPPGNGVSATVDGTEYEIPFTGSIVCDVTSDMIEARIGGSGSAQLQLSAQREGEGWLGNAVVYTPDGVNYTATIDPEADGPTIDGSTVGYEGLFNDGSGEVDGVVSLTCP